MVVIGYALIGLGMAVGFWRLGARHRGRRPRSDDDGIRERFGLGRSRRVVVRLSALFALDAFAGGFIPQSLMAYWFHVRFGVEPAVLGVIFFGANLLAAVSSLSAARIAARIGLINTMVFTHLPSNVLLILVPLMPTVPNWPSRSCCCGSASARWTCRPASRTSSPWSTRTSARRRPGVTGIARTIGAAISPSLSSVLMASAGLTRPCRSYLAGGLQDRLRPAALPRLPLGRSGRRRRRARRDEPPAAA